MCLSRYSFLASDGAALAVSAGREILNAVQLLEEGRAMAMLNLNQLRVKVLLLPYLGPEEETWVLCFRHLGKEASIPVAGGMKAESVSHVVDKEYKDYDTVIFGRYFLSTSDLVYRAQHG